MTETTLSKHSAISFGADAISDAFFVLVVPALSVTILVAALPCSSAIAQSSEPNESWASVSGRIEVEGELPEIPAERVGSHKDRPVCLVDGKIPADDQLVVDKAGGLRDAFVVLVPLEKDSKIPVHPSYLKAAETILELDNVNCRFEPHAMAVMTGQTVLLKNSDSVGHNCKISSMVNEHNVNLPAGGEAEIKIEFPDRIPASVTCDIHPWMDAVVLAKDHPYVAVTSADGTFEMKNVPAGKWKLQFWHQRFGYLRKLEVSDSEIDRRGQMDVQLQNGNSLDLGSMKLPAASIR